MSFSGTRRALPIDRRGAEPRRDSRHRLCERGLGVGGRHQGLPGPARAPGHLRSGRRQRIREAPHHLRSCRACRRSSGPPSSWTSSTRLDVDAPRDDTTSRQGEPHGYRLCRVALIKEGFPMQRALIALLLAALALAPASFAAGTPAHSVATPAGSFAAFLAASSPATTLELPGATPSPIAMTCSSTTCPGDFDCSSYPCPGTSFAVARCNFTTCTPYCMCKRCGCNNPPDCCL